MSSPADEQLPTSPALHDALEPIAFLVGTWRGVGVGGYPTIGEFRYEQEVVFSSDGRPFLQYASRSWILDDDGRRVRPAASELGWWRPGAQPRSLEVMLAHHTGVVEIYHGEVTFTKIELATDVVARTESAKEVSGFKRLYGLVGGEDGGEKDLAYAIDMAAVGQPLQAHLSARLAKVV
ncbi:MAG TPA: FABP family protein [Mycobacteriales bacterium]|nr:FABP family protein [Mycobacteriales bacterium]